MVSSLVLFGGLHTKAKQTNKNKNVHGPRIVHHKLQIFEFTEHHKLVHEAHGNFVLSQNGSQFIHHGIGCHSSFHANFGFLHPLEQINI